LWLSWMRRLLGNNPTTFKEFIEVT